MGYTITYYFQIKSYLVNDMNEFPSLQTIPAILYLATYSNCILSNQNKIKYLVNSHEHRILLISCKIQQLIGRTTHSTLFKNVSASSLIEKQSFHTIIFNL